MSRQSRAAFTIHKFGGACVADAAGMARVAQIMTPRAGARRAIVLSACNGVTDELHELIAAAERRDEVGPGLAALQARHGEAARLLLAAESAARYVDELAADLRDAENALATVRLTRSAAPDVVDLIAGYGEIWASRLFARYFGERFGAPLRWLDARKVVVVEWGPLGPAVDWARSRAAIVAQGLADFDGDLAITGSLASTRQGAQTTLGRNGSDFSASIFGALLGAEEICIWTDVDGVLSADPGRVPDAKVIDELSYDEAMELAYFGAKVLHPQTMGPAIADRIPMRILNAFSPEAPGTLICANPKSVQPVKGITSIEGVALINLEGAGMIGVPGTAHRLFGALREASTSVTLISQGSSEHSICCAVPEDQADRAAAAAREAFSRELKSKQIHDVAVDRGLAILAVVGDGMAGAPGIAAKAFAALGRASVNVRAIAQGASERNISMVVDQRKATRALRAAHAEFYLSPNTLSIGIIGPGSVGAALLDQLAAQASRLRDEFNVDLRVRAILSSRRLARFDRGVELSSWRRQWESAGDAADIELFLEQVRADHLPHSLVIDCSASEDVARRYAGFFTRGVHVVTASKKATSAEYAYYQAMREARRRSGTHFLYEATVGAGLPIVQTLRELRETGDDIVSIDGIFSGTLAYLFNVYDGAMPFSAVVAEARRRGYTEPDPRDDLSGLDVARKLIILAREMGLKLELGDVAVESLVPVELQSGSADEFMRRLPEFDERMKERLEGARARGAVLRHVGRVTASGEAQVGVAELEAEAALANTALTDNIVRYTTRRYNSNPLIVQGPGAGPEVTAAGVFADVLRLASYLGARM
jgi:aspartokinase/homoserine dehydrogenase 1